MLIIYKRLICCHILSTTARGAQLGEQGWAGLGEGVREMSFPGPEGQGMGWGQQGDMRMAWMGKCVAIDRKSFSLGWWDSYGLANSAQLAPGLCTTALRDGQCWAQLASWPP